MKKSSLPLHERLAAKYKPLYKKRQNRLSCWVALFFTSGFVVALCVSFWWLPKTAVAVALLSTYALWMIWKYTKLVGNIYSYITKEEWQEEVDRLYRLNDRSIENAVATLLGCSRSLAYHLLKCSIGLSEHNSQVHIHHHERACPFLTSRICLQDIYSYRDEYVIPHPLVAKVSPNNTFVTIYFGVVDPDDSYAQEAIRIEIDQRWEEEDKYPKRKIYARDLFATIPCLFFATI